MSGRGENQPTQTQEEGEGEYKIQLWLWGFNPIIHRRVLPFQSNSGQVGKLPPHHTHPLGISSQTQTKLSYPVWCSRQSEVWCEFSKTIHFAPANLIPIGSRAAIVTPSTFITNPKIPSNTLNALNPCFR